MGTVNWGKSDHVRIVFEIASGMRAANTLNTYCEVGISRGVCFNRVAPLAVTAIGIDIEAGAHEYIKGNRNLCWCHGRSDDALEAIRKQNRVVDLMFVDGSHKYPDALADVKAGLGLLRPETGLLIMHDVYPPDEQHRNNPHLCGDVYRAVDDIRALPGVELCVLPFYYGLAIIRRTE